MPFGYAARLRFRRPGLASDVRPLPKSCAAHSGQWTTTSAVSSSWRVRYASRAAAIRELVHPIFASKRLSRELIDLIAQPRRYRLGALLTSQGLTSQLAECLPPLDHES
jgi:hypothetical protein